MRPLRVDCCNKCTALSVQICTAAPSAAAVAQDLRTAHQVVAQEVRTLSNRTTTYVRESPQDRVHASTDFMKAMVYTYVHIYQR